MSEPQASTSRANGVANLRTKDSSALTKKVKSHPLFPAIEKLLIKIEAAMLLNGDESIFDIKEIIQEISQIRALSGKEDAELDKFMQEMLATQATQLRELQHVIGFIDQFINKYKHALRKRVPIEALVGSVDSDDELPCSPASSSDEPVAHFAASQVDQEAPSLAVMHTPQGMVSIPLRLPPSEAQQAATRRLNAATPSPMDETFRIRMMMIQTALNPNLTAEETRKVAGQLGCSPKQLEEWITDFRKHSAVPFMAGRQLASEEETKDRKRNGKR